MANIFKGLSVKSLIRDFSNVAGALTGARTSTSPVPTFPQETTRSSNGREGGTYENIFSEALEFGQRFYENQTQMLAKEQQESGQMENGP